MDWPACSRTNKRRGGLRLGQWLVSHVHSLGQRPAGYRPNADTKNQLDMMIHIHPLNTNAYLSVDTGDGTCVAMTAGQIGGFWDDKSCLEKYGFFCEKPRPDITPPTKAPTPPPAQGCADGWTALPHLRNCYKVNSQQPLTQLQPWVTAASRSVVLF